MGFNATGQYSGANKAGKQLIDALAFVQPRHECITGQFRASRLNGPFHCVFKSTLYSLSHSAAPCPAFVFAPHYISNYLSFPGNTQPTIFVLRNMYDELDAKTAYLSAFHFQTGLNMTEVDIRERMCRYCIDR